MALNITSPLNTAQGFEISDTYARISVTDQYRGKSLIVNLDVYASENAFDTQAFALNIVDADLDLVVDYDRDTMSKDILDLAHDKMIAHLADQGITATKILN